MTGFEEIAAVVAVVGTVVSTTAAIQQGQAQRAQANYASEIAKQQAQASAAQGSLLVKQDQKRTMLVESDAEAHAAASGGGGDDPTVVTGLGNIASQGEANAQLDLYNSGTRASALNAQSGLDSMEGSNAAQAGWEQGFSNLLSGAGKTAGYVNNIPSTGMTITDPSSLTVAQGGISDANTAANGPFGKYY